MWCWTTIYISEYKTSEFTYIIIEYFIIPIRALTTGSYKYYTD